MEVAYLRELNFHTPTKEEMKHIRRLQRKRRMQSFFKRLVGILLILVFIGVVQTIARQTSPHRFSAANTTEVLYGRLTKAFVIANIISYAQLLFMSYVYFQKKTAEIVHVKVVEKKVSKHLLLFTVTTRELFCECINAENDILDEYKDKFIKRKDNVFIKDGIDVDGIFEYSNVKKGDCVYIERFEDDGNYIYHLVA